VWQGAQAAALFAQPPEAWYNPRLSLVEHPQELDLENDLAGVSR